LLHAALAAEHGQCLVTLREKVRFEAAEQERKAAGQEEVFGGGSKEAVDLVFPLFGKHFHPQQDFFR
jgi:hypothetical protein